MLSHLRHFILVVICALAMQAVAAERVTYFVPNAQGSPIAAMDEQGDVIWRESYEPYGQRRIQAQANDARATYAGKPEDIESGFLYMGARWYDPDVGRFTGIDPQGFAEGNPQSFGRYVYANASPYRYTDPNGESPVDVLFFAYDAAAFATAVNSGNPVAMWESGGDLAASFLGVVSPVPGAGEMIKAAKSADKVAEAGRVFWSGGQKAFEAAEAFAREKGRRVLEMTDGAKKLMAEQKNMSRAESGKKWHEISKEWAEGAIGEVDVFIHQPKFSTGSVWAQTEKPSLMQNPAVTRINHHDVE